MACSTLLSFWWAAIVVLVIFAAHTQHLFIAYCREIAAFEGQEVLSKPGIDDLGTSEFERDMFYRILMSTYPIDEKFSGRGRLIRICWLVQIAGIGVIIVWGICLDSLQCM